MISKKLQKILDKHKVKFRDKPQRVTHLMYRTETECTPEQFAVYECAIKAVYMATQIYNARNNEVRNFWNMMGHYNAVTEPNNIRLPYISDEMTLEEGERANADYVECRKWLEKAGLYYDLLD